MGPILTGEKSWWEKVPSYTLRNGTLIRVLEEEPEKVPSKDLDSKKQEKYKDLVDPLNTVRRYLAKISSSPFIII